jgi:septal ring factor EnvC (AmiA/AmiB activator)
MKIEKGIGWVGDRSATVGEYVYEIERLRAALDEQRRQVSLLNGHDTLAQFQAHIAELEEEIERLRAALREIADGYIDSGGNRRDLENSCARAREALGETDKDKEYK